VNSSSSKASSSSTASEFQVPVASPPRYIPPDHDEIFNVGWSITLHTFRRMKRSVRPIQEQRAVEDTVSTIRLRTRHHDPYEEWERATRKDAYVGSFSSCSVIYNVFFMLTTFFSKRAACKQQSETRTALTDAQERTQARMAQTLQAQHEAQVREVEAHLSALHIQRQERERVLLEGWKERDRRLWDRIEGVIKIEEEKVCVRLEEERKKREAEEKVREEKRLKEELKKQQEEKQRKEEEEAKRKEAEEKQALLEAETKRAEKEKADAEQREALGIFTPLQDWTHMRKTLLVCGSPAPFLATVLTPDLSRT
jgi:nucleoporin GLE1